MSSVKRPETLAPVGSLEMALAAIHAGADALYVGAPGANARGRTRDLSLEEFDELFRLTRLYGVRCYLAINTLLFEEEIPELVEKMKSWAEWQTDGWIIQDVGVAYLAHHLFPDQPLHVSTQMTVASAEAIEALQPLGFSRVVLARELSIKQIGAIAETLRSRGSEMELEVFVHGALCISFSGQCLSSESFGGRSANRGECAQSCRLDYQLWVDGMPQKSDGRRYWLSPKDLCALDELKELSQLGIASFKIEGRLKTPEYVAAAVRAYRECSLQNKEKSVHRSALARLFSRGFFSGWLRGPHHKKLVDGFVSAPVGESLGEVLDLNRDRILLGRGVDLRAGDGLLLLHLPSGAEWGGRIHEVIEDLRGRWLRMDPGCDLRSVRPGWSAFVNNSPQLERELRRLWESREERRRISVEWVVKLEVGASPTVVLRDSDHHQIELCGAERLEARRSAGDEGWISEELHRVAEPWSTRRVELEKNGDPFLPRSILRELKQRALAELERLRCEKPLDRLNSGKSIETLSPFDPEEQRRIQEWRTDRVKAPVQLHLVIRTLEQIDAVRDLPVASVTIDLERGVSRRRALEQLRALGVVVGIATPRTLMAGEQSEIERLVDLTPDRILVRNLGALQLLRSSGIPLWGDTSLNAANSFSASWLLQQGLERIAPSFDLNGEQLLSMLDSGGVHPDRIEIPLLYHMPLFHSAHCVFADALGTGGDSFSCGTPCLKHRVDLRDHKGEHHHLQSDSLCRNTLYRGTTQSLLRFLAPLMESGVSHFRIEALDEKAVALREKIGTLTSCFEGRLSAEEALSRLGALDRGGVSEGEFSNRRRWRDRKKDEV